MVGLAQMSGFEEKSMNRRELIKLISENGNITQTMADNALTKILTSMSDAMKNGEKVSISGFGAFRVLERAPQKGRNPNTGQSMTISGRNVIKFKPGKKLFKKVQ